MVAAAASALWPAPGLALARELSIHKSRARRFIGRPYEATLQKATRCRAAQESDIFSRETEPQEPVIIDLQEPRAHASLCGIVGPLKKPAHEARFGDGSSRWDRRHTLPRELYGHDHHLTVVGLRSCLSGADRCSFRREQ